MQLSPWQVFFPFFSKQMFTCDTIEVCITGSHYDNECLVRIHAKDAVHSYKIKSVWHFLLVTICKQHLCWISLKIHEIIYVLLLKVASKIQPLNWYRLYIVHHSERSFILAKNFNLSTVLNILFWFSKMKWKKRKEKEKKKAIGKRNPYLLNAESRILCLILFY